MSDGFPQDEAGTLAEVAAALNAGHTAGARFPALIFVTDDTRVPDPVAALAKLPKGCAVLFRHYAHPERAALAKEVARAAKAQERLLIIAGDIELARSVEADGFHLPEHMLSTLTKRPPFDGLVTAAVHSADALGLAAKMNCDAALLSPVFQTASHEVAAPLGIDEFSKLTRQTDLPVYALGGITNSNAAALFGMEAVGIAAISGLQG